MVLCISSNLYDQDGILPFVQSIEEDLGKAREKHHVGKDPSGVHSYAMLVLYYRNAV